MKKVFLTLILTILPLLASAETVEIDGIWYNLIPKAKEAEVTGNPNGYSENVEIPESVMNDGVEYKVTSIGSSTFYDCRGLTSVTIPNSVTSIGYEAFRDCTSLTSVTIGNSVTSIGNEAFYYCSGLTSITIPNSVTSIDMNAFSGCTSLTSLTIGNSVTSIGNYAFSDCSNLTSVYISDLEAWCRINFSSFESNPLIYAHHLYLDGEEVEDLVIPNSVTSIGDFSFWHCRPLTSVTIPNSVTSIGYGSFYGCSGLTSVTIGNNVASIGYYAFSGCSSLSSVTIPNSVTSIGDWAFYRCTGLTSVTIPNSVTSVGSSAFSGCSDLISVTIPNNVTSIGNSAFYGCRGLTSVTIPNSVRSIDWYAFSGCSNLTSVTIPNSVIVIRDQAFANCDELMDVYCLANDVPYTSLDAFKDSYPQAMTLHVPVASIEAYRSTEPWSQFKTFVALEDGDTPTIQKCATPEINYTDGKVSFSCETEGVEYISDVTVADAKKYYDSEFTLSQTYKITVYAVKTGYENSDVVTREIVIENGQSSLFGDLNKDGKVNVADHVKLSDIIMNK